MFFTTEFTKSTKVLKAKQIPVRIVFRTFTTPIRKNYVVAQRAAHFFLHFLQELHD